MRVLDILTSYTLDSSKILFPNNKYVCIVVWSSKFAFDCKHAANKIHTFGFMYSISSYANSKTRDEY